ncbi:MULTISPECIES: hypothetical protein [unclassified Endozoicomonas]|uniref:hypothetical protein n=1 Tax=unclassified Endozoicomonas TaxID=2644528 RepID=UPI003BAF4412
MEFKKVAVALALSAGLASFGLQAATNPGSPSDTTSSGDFDITLYNSTQIQIYGLDDVEIVDTGTADATGTTPVCVAANVDNFNISMSSTSAFNLTNAGGASNIPYTLTLQDSGGTAIADGVWGVGQNSNGEQSSTDLARTTGNFADVASGCSGSYSILVTPDYTGAADGLYADTVTVEVAPI